MSKRTRTAKTRRPEKGETIICVGCGDRIHAAYVRDITKQPWHQVCRRMGVKASQALHHKPTRYKGRTQDTCQGCDTPVTDSDNLVHVSAVPWHKDCYLRR